MMPFATQNLWAHVAIVTAMPVNEMGALGYCFVLRLSRVQNTVDYESLLQTVQTDSLKQSFFFGEANCNLAAQDVLNLCVLICTNWPQFDLFNGADPVFLQGGK
jgi:hypothetical protein